MDKKEFRPTFLDLYNYIQHCKIENEDSVYSYSKNYRMHYPLGDNMKTLRPWWSFFIYHSRTVFQFCLPDGSFNHAGVLRVSFEKRYNQDEVDSVRLENVHHGMRDFDNFIVIPINGYISSNDGYEWWQQFDYGMAIRNLLMEVLTSAEGRKVIEGTS